MKNMYEAIKSAIKSVTPDIDNKELDYMAQGIVTDQSATAGEVAESLGFHRDLFTEGQFGEVCRKVSEAVEKSHDSGKYSVFYKDGDEANDEYLDIYDAVSFSNHLEDEGYDVIIARLGDDGQWVTVYES